jgi:hypothetical protein
MVLVIKDRSGSSVEINVVEVLGYRLKCFRLCVD